MAKLKFTTIAFALCVCLAAGFFFIHWQDHMHLIPEYEHAAPDAFAQSVNTVEFDSEGKVKRQFRANNIDVFEKSEVANTIKPTLEMLLSNGKQLTIQAMHGNLYDKTQVNLDGKVTISTVTTEDWPMTMLTERCSYNIKTEIAETDLAIVIDSPKHFRLTAMGASADFKQEKINLHHKVRGVYEPTH